MAINLQPQSDDQPPTVIEALSYADMMKGNPKARRRTDEYLQVLAAEVRRLNADLDKLAQAASNLGEFILEQAG